MRRSIIEKENEEYTNTIKNISVMEESSIEQITMIEEMLKSCDDDNKALVLKELLNKWHCLYESLGSLRNNFTEMIK